jgi:ribosome assembly protein YihI (activator of Der GTPase)
MLKLNLGRWKREMAGEKTRRGREKWRGRKREEEDEESRGRNREKKRKGWWVSKLV